MIRRPAFGVLIIYLIFSLYLFSSINSIQMEKSHKISSSRDSHSNSNSKTNSGASTAVDGADIGSTCLKALMDNVPPSFCWKKGADAGKIPSGCPEGWFRSLALCYEHCSSDYRHILGICYKNCPEGYTDHGLTCYKNLIRWYFKHSYIPSSATNFSSKVACPPGFYKGGALCYRDCSNIQMANCGIGACSYDSASCATEIFSMIMDTLMGLAEAFLFIASFGTSSTAVGPAKKAVKEGVEKVGKKGVQKSFKAIKKLFSSKFRQELQDKAKKKAKKMIKEALKDMITEYAVDTICSAVFDTVALSVQRQKSETPAEKLTDALDIFNIKGIVQNCQDTSQQNGALDCARSVVQGLTAVDPTGLLTIASAFMKPVCDVPAIPYQWDTAAGNQIQQIMELYIDDDCIYIFEECNFKGDYREICGDQNQIQGFDDKTSSIRTGKNVNVMFFEHPDKEGRHFLLGKGAELKCLADFNVEEVNFNNMISSVKFNINGCVIFSKKLSAPWYGSGHRNVIYCKKEQVTLFKLGGLEELTIELFEKNQVVTLLNEFNGTSYELTSTERWDDNVRKFPLQAITKVMIKINAPAGCLVLFEECDFNGQSKQICEDSPNIPDFFPARSVMVGSGVTAILFEQPDYRGHFFTFQNKGNVECLETYHDNTDHSFEGVMSAKFGLDGCVMLTYTTETGSMWSEFFCKRGDDGNDSYVNLLEKKVNDLEATLLGEQMHISLHYIELNEQGGTLELRESERLTYVAEGAQEIINVTISE
jgi:hypothetical protein